MPHIQHFRSQGCHAIFVGRDAAWKGTPREVLHGATAHLGVTPPSHLAHLRQVHSAHVAKAEPGTTPEADALVTDRSDVALAVVTADCVPMLLVSEGAIAAVHAGWRGLASGIIRNAVGSMGNLHGVSHRATEITAWIGPCMAACCYEVGHDVALAVARRSGAGAVVIRGASRKPSVGLEHAAAAQLSQLGIEDIRPSNLCTGCSSETWWSYRKLGPGAGRNLAFVWREP